MNIIYLDQIDSTHTYLQNYIKQKGYKGFCAAVATFQTNGIGSRDNKWIGKRGNLFFSFVIDKNSLPEDLPIGSASIYFSYLFKEILKNKGSKVWIKWPNDFYLEDKKIGGTITGLKGELLYCGIGLNLKKINDTYEGLDISFDIKTDLTYYFSQVQSRIKWKQIFSKYLVEFDKSRTFHVTVDNKKVPLINAELNEDGSICIDNKKVFSLR